MHYTDTSRRGGRRQLNPGVDGEGVGRGGEGRKADEFLAASGTYVEKGTPLFMAQGPFQVIFTPDCGKGLTPLPRLPISPVLHQIWVA